MSKSDPTWKDVEQVIEKLKGQDYTPFKLQQKEHESADEYWVEIRTERTTQDK